MTVRRSRRRCGGAGERNALSTKGWSRSTRIRPRESDSSPDLSNPAGLLQIRPRDARIQPTYGLSSMATWDDRMNDVEKAGTELEVDGEVGAKELLGVDKVVKGSPRNSRFTLRKWEPSAAHTGKAEIGTRAGRKSAMVAKPWDLARDWASAGKRWGCSGFAPCC